MVGSFGVGASTAATWSEAATWIGSFAGGASSSRWGADCSGRFHEQAGAGFSKRSNEWDREHFIAQCRGHVGRLNSGGAGCISRWNYWCGGRLPY